MSEAKDMEDLGSVQMTGDDFGSVTAEEIENIPIAEMDEALVKAKELVAKYKAKKAESGTAFGLAEKAKEEFIALMKRAGKKRWSVEGHGGFSMHDELKFKVPAGNTEKELFFNFLASQEVADLLMVTPDEVRLSYMTVHSATMNKLCVNLKELAAKEGNDLQLPGIAAPKAEPKLRSVK